MLLTSHPLCDSTDIEEFEGLLKYHAGGQSFDATGDRPEFRFRVNMTRGSKVTVLWSTCNLQTCVSFSPVTYVRQVFTLRNTMSVAFDGDELRTCSDRLGQLIPDNIAFRQENEAHVDTLTLRIESDILRSNLEAMIGEAVNHDLRFMPVEHNDPHRALNLRTALYEYVRELDTRDRRLSSVALAELEQGLVLRFLLYNKSNYTRFLERPPVSVHKAQIRRVEEYLVENWEKPLDIAMLAAIAGVSARSLFRNFQKSHGISPQAFVKRVRLEQARSMLMRDRDETSIRVVASRCGFQALGHFASDYRALFGELPSETARHRRA